MNSQINDRVEPGRPLRSHTRSPPPKLPSPHDHLKPIRPATRPIPGGRRPQANLIISSPPPRPPPGHKAPAPSTTHPAPCSPARLTSAHLPHVRFSLPAHRLHPVLFPRHPGSAPLELSPISAARRPARLPGAWWPVREPAREPARAAAATTTPAAGASASAPSSEAGAVVSVNIIVMGTSSGGVTAAVKFQVALLTPSHSYASTGNGQGPAGSGGSGGGVTAAASPPQRKLRTTREEILEAEEIEKAAHREAFRTVGEEMRDAEDTIEGRQGLDDAEKVVAREMRKSTNLGRCVPPCRTPPPLC